jgi:hypothetical protein
VAGEVKAGFGVVSEDDGVDDTEDTRVKGENSDTGDTNLPLRTRLTFGYDSDLGGAKARLEASNFHSDAAPNYVAMPFAFGWANFLDKKIVVYGGKIDGNLWGLGALSINAFDPGLDAVTGVRAAFNVVPGLSFGFALPVDKVDYVSTYGSSPTKADRTVAAFFGGAVFGALYTSDLFGVAATMKLNPQIDSKEYGGTADSNGDYGKRDMFIEAVVGVEVHPIDPLKVVVDAKFDTRKFDKDLYAALPSSARIDMIGYSRIGLKAAYDVTSQLGVYLKGIAFIPNDKADDKSEIDDLTVGTTSYVGNGDYGAVETLGDVAIAPELGVSFAVTPAIVPYFNIGSDNVLWIAGDKDKGQPGAGLYFKIGGTITVGSSTIEIFDKVTGLGAEDLAAVTGGANPKEERSPDVNRFQVNFNWVF